MTTQCVTEFIQYCIQHSIYTTSTISLSEYINKLSECIDRYYQLDMLIPYNDFLNGTNLTFHIINLSVIVEKCKPESELPSIEVLQSMPDTEEYGTCCYCNGDCNILSQSCGLCSRGLSGQIFGFEVPSHLQKFNV